LNVGGDGRERMAGQRGGWFGAAVSTATRLVASVVVVMQLLLLVVLAKKPRTNLPPGAVIGPEASTTTTGAFRGFGETTGAWAVVLVFLCGSHPGRSVPI
jgi:hypothetical protein